MAAPGGRLAGTSTLVLLLISILNCYLVLAWAGATPVTTALTRGDILLVGLPPKDQE